MIQDTSAMDQPVGRTQPLARRLLVPGILVGAALLVAVFVAPSLSRWLRAERSIDLSKIRVATVGNPAMRVPSATGFPLPSILGILPGMSAFATHMMNKEMDALDIPPIDEFVEMISDAGGHLYACKATVDMFHLTQDDFVPQMEKVLTVGDFYEMAGGGEIIFT